jgi:sulfite reductase (NADPH) hemoprotein beta-component
MAAQVQLYSEIVSPFDPAKLADVVATSANRQLPALVVLSPSTLIQLSPSLKAIAASPIVLQVSTSAGDHSQVLALRGAGIALLYSADEEQASKNAAVAARVAASTHRAVLHFGEFATNADLHGKGVDASWVLSKLEGAKANGSIPSTSSIVGAAFNEAFSSLPSSLSASAKTSSGDSSAPETLIIALGNATPLATHLPPKTELVQLSLYRPLSASQIRQLVKPSVSTIVVLEQTYSKTAKWSPVFLDVVGAFAEGEDDEKVPAILSGTLGKVTDGKAAVQELQGSSSLLAHLRAKI